MLTPNQVLLLKLLLLQNSKSELPTRYLIIELFEPNILICLYLQS